MFAFMGNKYLHTSQKYLHSFHKYLHIYYGLTSKQFKCFEFNKTPVLRKHF